jgi:hypothetical protein
MARDLLGLQARVPWEFAEKPPCRSVISAALTSGVPLLLTRGAGRLLSAGWLEAAAAGGARAAMPLRGLGLAVLLAPRVWMVCTSLIMCAPGRARAAAASLLWR